MSTYLLVLMVIITILNIFILMNLHKLKKSSRTSEVHEIHDIHKEQQGIGSLSDVNMLSSYELERLKREEEFDKRIRMMKDELAYQHTAVRENTIAEELHPLVKNIPHNVIRTSADVLPDVEIAE